MRKFLYLILLSLSLNAGESFEEYKSSVLKDLSEFDKIVSFANISAIHNTNNIIRDRIIKVSSMQNLDLLTLVYLKHKQDSINSLRILYSGRKSK